jgi:phosphate transport system permease protein
MADVKAAPRTTAGGWAKQTQHGDVIFWLLTMFFALVIVGLVVAVGVVTYSGSAEVRATYGWSFLWQPDWNPIETDLFPASFGAWPAIRGTLLSSLFALLLAGPVGVAIGIFLAELCPLRFKATLGFLVELLAAIPSVIYGLWGVAVFSPFFTSYIATPIADTVGQIVPWLAGPVSSGRGLILASIILALMILPTISAISRDVLMAVPNNQREVLLSLGATRWEVIWLAVLPYARAGIIGGIMLGLGRALGETMAATMLIGNSTRIEESLFLPATTSASLIASELTNANDTLHESALIAIALVLFAITLLLNMAARFLVWQTSRGPAGARG